MAPDTLNAMLVILFGLTLLLVGRTNDQQTQQAATNESICVLAIRSGLSTRGSGVQLSQVYATGLGVHGRAESARYSDLIRCNGVLLRCGEDDPVTMSVITNLHSL
jgi:hypothetical protein